MVALNYQTDDAGLNLNAAMFEQNGQCGYVRNLGYVGQGSHDVQTIQSMGQRIRRSTFGTSDALDSFRPVRLSDEFRGQHLRGNRAGRHTDRLRQA